MKFKKLGFLLMMIASLLSFSQAGFADGSPRLDDIVWTNDNSDPSHCTIQFDNSSSYAEVRIPSSRYYDCFGTAVGTSYISNVDEIELTWSYEGMFGTENRHNAWAEVYAGNDLIWNSAYLASDQDYQMIRNARINVAGYSGPIEFRTGVDAFVGMNYRAYSSIAISPYNYSN